MNQDTMDISSAGDRAHPTALYYALTESSPPASLNEEATCSCLSISALVAGCLREISNYRQGEAYREIYGLELLRRATIQGDSEAWTGLEHCFHEVVLGWLRRHPSREAACRLESEENYIAQAFERFWQATTLNRQVEFCTLASALQYLRASLNGAMIDTLRTYSRAREISLPEPDEPGEPQTEEYSDSGEIWELLQTMLPDMREQRIAYLLFHCGLKPREIMRFCPQEFDDIREIYRLRRNIMERLRRNTGQLRWQLITI